MDADNLIPFPGGFNPFQLRAAQPLPGRAERAGFIVRVDLDDTDPPVWRRLRLAGDLALDQLHEILQVAMGWTDSHLHHFVMGPGDLDRQVQPFLTPFDVEEGDEGILEADVRIDQVLTDPGDRLFYEYDFGDGWEHTIRLEAVEPWAPDDPPARCLDGDRACPPEDVGGIGGFAELQRILAGNVAGMDPEWVDQLLNWLPEGYDPAAFSVDAVNEELSSGPLPRLERWHPMIADLLRRAGGSGLSDLGRLIKRVAAADAPALDPKDVQAAVRRYSTLLRVVGDGLTLTAAGYLPPRIVESLYVELDMGDEWIGKGNREDMTQPVLELRQSATALGLVRKARGRLTVTAVGRRLAGDPEGLWRHIASRLPLGRAHERDAGLLALLFTAAGVDWYRASDDAEFIMADLGWSVSGGDLGRAVFAAAWPSMDVLNTLTGRRGRHDTAPSVARGLLTRADAGDRTG